MYTVVSCAVILALCVSETIVQSCIDTQTDSDEDGQPFKKCGSSKNVGSISPLIINGTEAQLGSFPWHAGLYYRKIKNGAESWEQGCAGSLITDRFVLTAAHCVTDINETDVRVALGKIYQSWDEDECSQQKRNVSKITYPFEFHRQTYYFDIALLLLDEKVKLGELVMPVCTGLQGGSDYLLNQQLFIVGWGQTQSVDIGSDSETLLYNDVMFIPQRDCQRFVAQWFSLFDKFCIRKNNSAESVIQRGDSGGGLTVVNEGLHYIFGIVSVKYNGRNHQTSLLTNVTWVNHINWIENQIRKYDTSYSWYGDETAAKDSSSKTIAQSCMDTQTDSDKDGQPFKKCGVSKHVGRIINGTEAQLGSFPWHAGLYYRHEENGTESWVPRCGGSLITDRFVLTGAGCLKGINETDVRIALGKIYRSWDKDECSQQKRNVSKVLYPHEFNGQFNSFNIGLLLLDENVKLGELVMPVCTGLQAGSDHLRNQQLFIPGWTQMQNLNSGSASEFLYYNDLMVIPQGVCQRSVSHMLFIGDKFCARKNNYSEESVVQRRDSGTGLTVANEGLHYVLGIVNAKSTDVTILANLTWHDHIEWIENQIRNYDTSYSWYGDKTATKDTSRG